MTDPPRLVIPCFNPHAGWACNLVRRTEALRSALGVPALRITIVDDGTTHGITDADRELLRQQPGGVLWITHGINCGKGAALRTGVAAEEGACLITDIDLPYELGSMVAVCRALMGGADVVLGQRGDPYYAHVPPVRRAISNSFRWVLRNLMRFPVSDTQCGLKGFNPRGRELFLATTIDQFLFDMEFVMLVSRHNGLHVELVDAKLNEGVRFSRMNYRILLHESFNFLRVVLRSALKK